MESAPVCCRLGTRGLGSGADSILLMEPSTNTRLAVDSDWFDQEITLADASGFRLGDGVCIRAKNPLNNGQSVCKRTLVARSGNRFKLDRALRENFWQMGDATVSTLFPILTGEGIADVAIENIVLDGNKGNNDNIEGDYSACIFLQDCSRATIRGVTVRNYNGDGIRIGRQTSDVRLTENHIEEFATAVADLHKP